MVGGAEKIRPACQLRCLLGWLDQGERQQGYVTGWQMIHALITMGLAALAWPFVLHAEAAAMSAAFYCGREHAQAEYRVIKSFYGGKRANAHWWCGFERRAWDAKSMVDLVAPVIIVVAVTI